MGIFIFPQDNQTRASTAPPISAAWRPASGSLSAATEVEKLIYDWCISQAPGSESARTLAAVYASAYMDEFRLLRFADLRALDEARLQWALAMIQGYAEGTVSVPWPRALALVALYDLIPDELDA